MRRLAVRFGALALLGLAAACAAGSPSAALPTAEAPVRGQGSAGPTAREQPRPQGSAPIETGGRPTIVFVDADG